MKAPAMLTTLHGRLTLAWGALLIPSVVWWRSSLPWIVFMSCYANFASHWSAHQGQQAERASWENP